MWLLTSETLDDTRSCANFDFDPPDPTSCQRLNLPSCVTPNYIKIPEGSCGLFGNHQGISNEYNKTRREQVLRIENNKGKDYTVAFLQLVGP